MLDICGCRLSKTKAAVVAGLVHRATGGQAYLSRQLCAFLARVSPNTLGPAVVERIADTIARQNRDQFDLWPTELSEPAMVAFALLRKQSSVAKRDLTTALEERELQPTLARRAALQCAFSGIAEYRFGQGGSRALEPTFLENSGLRQVMFGEAQARQWRRRAGNPPSRQQPRLHAGAKARRP